MSSADPGLLLADRYQLDDRIAAGGFGEVWQGTDLVLGRPVALKLLQAGFTGHAQTLARFRAEARHAGAVSHQGIARVYDYGEPDPPHPPFLVMELVDGPSLAGLLEDGPLDPIQVMSVVGQTAAGLHAAHVAGLVHRDVKPGNLLITSEGVVKITDFGIAHAAGSAPVTFTGEVMGTAAYLAPERVAGGRGDAASDLYSLGVVAYECLAGHRPFSGAPIEQALAHLDRPMPPLPAQVPAEVAALVGELTARDPADRPRDAGEVARRCRRLRDQLIAGTTDPAAAWPAAGRSYPERPAQPALNVGWPDRPDGHAEWPANTDQTVRQRRRGGGNPAGAWKRAGGGKKLALAGLAVAAIVLALILAGVSGPAPQPRAVAQPSSTSKPQTNDVRMVDIVVSALRGRPVSAVRLQLHRRGLVVVVRWRPTLQVRPGQVLSVAPGGWVRAGGTVVITGALQPRSDDHGHKEPPGQAKHHGNGPGHGHGGGDDQGGDGGQGNGDG